LAIQSRRGLLMDTETIGGCEREKGALEEGGWYKGWFTKGESGKACAVQGYGF